MDYRIEKLNQIIRGWINYYRIGSMKRTLTRIDKHLRTRMRIVIWKQWKKSAKRHWGLQKLGAPEWMAKQSVSFNNHYQAVAKTTGVHLISKEILTKRGLGVFVIAIVMFVSQLTDHQHYCSWDRFFLDYYTAIFSTCVAHRIGTQITDLVA